MDVQLQGSVYCGPENLLISSLITNIESVDTSTWLPLLLCGESGVGKSFFALTISDLWNDIRSKESSIVTTAADIVRLFQPAQLAVEFEQIKKRYLSTPLLVVDDVHQVAGKPNADAFLIKILDHRIRFALPTVVTTPSVNELNRLSRLLRSRLLAGLPVTLSMPSRETRANLIRKLASSSELEPSAEQIDSLVSQSDGFSVSATHNLASAVLSNRLPHIEQAALSAEELATQCVKASARRFGVRVADIAGSTRRKNAVLARSIAMFLIREFTSLSLADTGKFFQNRDHTTVRHAYHKIQKQLLSDRNVQDAVCSICTSLNQRIDASWFELAVDRCA